MGTTTTELLWLQQLLRAFNIHSKDPTLLFYHNDVAIQIITNPTLHKRTKHKEVD